MTENKQQITQSIWKKLPEAVPEVGQKVYLSFKGTGLESILITFEDLQPLPIVFEYQGVMKDRYNNEGPKFRDFYPAKAADVPVKYTEDCYWLPVNEVRISEDVKKKWMQIRFL